MGDKRIWRRKSSQDGKLLFLGNAIAAGLTTTGIATAVGRFFVGARHAPRAAFLMATKPDVQLLDISRRGCLEGGFMAFEFINSKTGKSLMLPWATADEFISLASSLGVPDPGEAFFDVATWGSFKELVGKALNEGRIGLQTIRQDSLGREHSLPWKEIQLNGPEPLDDHSLARIRTFLERLW